MESTTGQLSGRVDSNEIKRIKKYKEIIRKNAPVLKIMEGVEPSEASNPRTVITRSGSTTLL